MSAPTACDSCALCNPVVMDHLSFRDAPKTRWGIFVASIIMMIGGTMSLMCGVDGECHCKGFTAVAITSGSLMMAAGIAMLAFMFKVG